MSEFYKKLKALRKEKGISLDDIYQRTKINKSILELIENGQFEKLNKTYLRLFLKAYCNEIGKNPDDAIEELDKFLNVDTKIIQKNKDDNLLSERSVNNKLKEQISNKRSAKNIRSDIVKGTILITIFIFAIYIIRIINKEEAIIEPINKSNQLAEDGSITSNMLSNDYDILYESTFALEVESPFIIRIATAERTWYSFQTDSSNSLEAIIPSGENHQYKFNKSIKILFKHTKSLNLYLNNAKINGLEPSLTPILVNISSTDNNIRIQRFVPKLN